MIPLKDDNDSTKAPFVTLLMMGICIWVYFVVQPSSYLTVTTVNDVVSTQSAQYTVAHAAVPCELLHGRSLTETEYLNTFVQGDPNSCDVDKGRGAAFTPGKNVYASVLYSMFLHGGLLHLGGNLLFLWIFGNNVEARMGHLRYLAFYLVAGLFATVAYCFAQPNGTLPIIGASGAIAGVMGAYLVIHPNVKVRAWMWVFIFNVKAKYFLVLWFLSQFFIGPDEGIAWVAHVSGFLFGMAVGLWARRRQEDPPPVALVPQF